MAGLFDMAAKRVLVTGATKGIGRGAAEMFLEAGASVAVNGRNPETVAKAIEEMGGERLVAAPGDIGTIEGCQGVVEAAVAGLGGLDCLVSNAGIGDVARLEEVTEEHWDKMIAVNLRAAVFCTKYALPELRKSKGNVIHIASVAGLFGGPSDGMVYGITKGGLVNMTRTMAIELAGDGVRVNCLCPGYIQTPMIDAENEATGGQIFDFIAKSTPLGRIGTVRECASSILYLASDEAGYMTGSILSNDGGCAANASWGGANYADDDGSGGPSYTPTPRDN
jgi:NAD(P)-dependent dehydrogenase (short-subunit alcohol dehydrogenase family)